MSICRRYSLDDPMPHDLPQSNMSQSTFQYVMDMARKENLTIKQVALRVAGARGKAVVKGSPQQIADQMEEWFRNDGCDGFNLMPPFLPGGLDDFVEMVLPELRRRGLFRTEYEGARCASISVCCGRRAATWLAPGRQRSSRRLNDRAHRFDAVRRGVSRCGTAPGVVRNVLQRHQRRQLPPCRN